MFNIYALLLSSHHTYVLDMHLSLRYYALLIAYSDDHLLCYVLVSKTLGTNVLELQFVLCWQTMIKT